MSVKTNSSKIGLSTATCVIVANMIGTGVFTSLGFQVVDLQSGFTLLLLWFVGGIFAICGALAYSELGAAMPPFWWGILLSISNLSSSSRFLIGFGSR